MSVLQIDFETRATVDLREAGVYPYAEHKHTDIWCMAWAFDDEEAAIWTPDMPLPQRIVEHILAGGTIRAWNAQFERVIWNAIMVPRYGAPIVWLDQWECTAAEAAAMALPRSLDQAAITLGISEKKDQEGYGLMMRMTRPRAFLDNGDPIWWDVEERKQRLYAYCKQDVRVERAAGKVLYRLTPNERQIYLLDQRMNDRGMRIDVDLVHAAQEIVDEGVARANVVLTELTGGAVAEVTQNRQMVQWLQGQGMDTNSIAKPKLQEMLESDLDPAVRAVLETRAEAGRSSVAKLTKMLSCLCKDGMVRGLLLYHAASTGRWAGKLLQPQNFPRGEIGEIEGLIKYVMAKGYDMLALFAPPIEAVSAMLRAMLTARPGQLLLSADFSAIEARVLNWLAGQDDILELFRAMDAGDNTKHPYKRMAVKMGRGATAADIEKPSEDYQAGKAAELGCGFGMGKKKFVAAAWKVYQLRVTQEQADVAVDAYRESHQRVVEFWYETESACIRAVETPGEVQYFGGRKNLKAVVVGNYLVIVLPSGRPLFYAAPRVVEAPTPWGTLKPTLEFSGVDALSRQWGRLRAYGGLLVENIVQAVARDLMAEAMLRVEAAGFPPVLCVHDEIVAMVDEDDADLERFENIMREIPAWATGCPVLTEGWKGFRYRK